MGGQSAPGRGSPPRGQPPPGRSRAAAAWRSSRPKLLEVPAMSIPVTCPDCGKASKAPDSAAGKHTRCPKCGW